MALRVTEQSLLTDHISFMQTAQSRMDSIQEQLSTGKRVSKASDDPQGATMSMSYRRDISFEAQMRRNIDGGIAFMNATESALSSANDLIQRARELAVQGSNGTSSQEGRDAMSVEVDQILQQMVQIGNSNFGGAYIFSGQKTDQPAFVTQGAPQITSVSFQGDMGQRIRRTSQQDTAAVNVSGPTAFGSVFQDLINLRDNLKNNPSQVNLSIASMDTDLNGVLAARATIGARINAFTDTENRSQSKNTDLQTLRANIEDTDVTDAIVKLTAQQNQLQATLGAIGRTINMSLLDFIR